MTRPRQLRARLRAHYLSRVDAAPRADWLMLAIAFAAGVAVALVLR